MSSVWSHASARLLAALTAGALVLAGTLAVAPAAVADTTGGAIAGTVVDDQGQPLADAWVSVSPVDGAGDATGTWTDEAGVFEFAELRTTDYTVRFESNQEGLVGEWWEDEPSAAAASLVSVVEGETSQVHAALDPAASISGTVTDETGAPVVGGDVQVYRFDEAAESWEWQASAQTADDGSYTVGSLPFGTFAVAFGSGEGVEIVPEYWSDASSLEGSTPVELERGESVAGVDAQVQRAGRVTGVVLDDLGRPLENVSVSAHVEDVPGFEEWSSFGAMSNSDGTFALTSLPPGDYTVQFWPGEEPDLLGEWWDDAESRETASIVTVVAEAEVTGVDAQLAAGGLITGSVFDGAETPIPDANVVLYDAEGDVAQATSTLSNGIFALGNLKPGAYTLSFSADTAAGRLTEWWNNASDRESATPVEVTAGASTDGIDIVLDESDGSHLETFTASLSGVVTDGAGQPLEGVRVDVMASDGMSGDGTMTNAEGAWQMASMAAGSYVVSFTAVIGAETVTRFWDDAPDFASATVIDLARGERIEGISATLALPAPPDVDSSAPTIDGDAAVGSTLTVDEGTWTPGASFSYQWLANGAVIAGAIGSSLTLTSAHRDKAVSVRVTGSLVGYSDVTRVSDPTPRVMTATSPTITGSAAVGVKLTAVPGTWTSGTTFTYRWLAGGTPIAGATNSTFTPGTAHDGQAISVEVTGAKSGWATITKTSALTKKVMRATTPKITGTVAYGATLRVERGTWSPGTDLTQRWYADGKAISGATSTSLKLTSGLKGKRISVKVTGSASGYTTVSKTSASTGRVTVAATPTISGTRAVGATLTAKRGTWATGTTFSYQWYADGVAISGATKATYVVSSAREHDRITVKVTGRKSGYATVSKTSGATTRILRVGTPSISGTALVTRTLTASTGTWTSGADLRYQWYAGGKAISGATSRTLKLTSAHAGKTITVKVTGRLSGYATISKTSRATSSIGYPSRTAPTSSWNCPSWAPIKGNASSMIYHMPWQRYYDATKPEDCFRTESAAVAAGYRRAKV